MQLLPKIIYESIKSTGQKPSWWILALLQVLCLLLVFRQTFYFQKSFWLAVVALVLLPVVTAGLWLDIAAKREQKPRKLSLAWFFLLSARLGISLIISIILILFFRRTGLPWVIFVAVSSLLGGTATLASLYSCLFKQQVIFSWELALDAWRKKISFAAIFAFCLMLGQGIVFYLGSSIHWMSLVGEFSVFVPSATILVLSAVLLAIIGVLTAILNCFLVILFLETIKPSKEPEEEKLARVPVISSVMPESNV